jgi:dihydroorotase-like cyclic amidohydrolase
MKNFSTSKEHLLKSTHTVFGAAILAMICATSSAYAQGESRDQVKAETKAAIKAGTIPVVEGPNEQPALKTTKTRADRKAETQAAKASGEIARGGEANPSDGKTKTAGESRKRADVKAETAKAVKAGQIPSGEK